MKNFTTLKVIGRSYESANAIHFAVTVVRDGEAFELQPESLIEWGGEVATAGSIELARCLIEAAKLRGFGNWDAEFATQFVTQFPDNWELTEENLWQMLCECMNAEIHDDFVFEYNPFEDCDEFETQAAQTFQIGEVMALVA